MHAHDPFKTTKPHTKGVRRSAIHVEDLEVADDPPPQSAAWALAATTSCLRP